MNAQDIITTSNEVDNMELIYPSLAAEDRSRLQVVKRRISDHTAKMAVMLDEIKRWHK